MGTNKQIIHKTNNMQNTQIPEKAPAMQITVVPRILCSFVGQPPAGSGIPPPCSCLHGYKCAVW